MNRREYLSGVAKTAPIVGLAGCLGSGGSDGSGGGGGNQRYGLPPCSSSDGLAKVRATSIEYRGLDSRSNNYRYEIQITVEAVGTEPLVIQIRSGSVLDPDGNTVGSFSGTEALEYDTTATHTYEFAVNAGTQYDGSELSVTGLDIPAIPVDDWEMSDSPAPLLEAENRGCY